MRLLRGALTPVVSIALVFLFWDLIIRGFAVDTFVAPSPGETLAALRDNWSTLWPLALCQERYGLSRSGVALANTWCHQWRRLCMLACASSPLNAGGRSSKQGIKQ